MNYTLSNLASVDLENIWLYTVENWSLEQADRYLNLIFDEIEYVCLKPNSGSDFGKIRKGFFIKLMRKKIN
jgi:toxin ParE1/3/4